MKLNRRNGKAENKKKNKMMQFEKLIGEDKEVENDMKQYMSLIKKKRQIASIHNNNSNEVEEHKEKQKEPVEMIKPRHHKLVPSMHQELNIQE